MKPTATHQPTVFVVDDDAQLRDSLQALLEALGFPMRAFPSARAFREHYDARMPGCLVLDVRMPGCGGLELFEQLVRDGKRLPVIFITAHADVTTAVAAMKSGAIEFLEKPFDRQTFEDRLRKALALDAEWRRSEAEFAAVRAKLDRLNDRDVETLELIAAGESNKAMAARLFISERAVEMRRARIMQKLEVSSLPELLDLTIGYRILCDLRTMGRVNDFR